jgi:hypothetical protein
MNKKSLYRRVEQLEADARRPRRRTQAEEESMRLSIWEKINATLRERGIVKRPEESMADAYARAFGVTTRELKDLFEQALLNTVSTGDP